ncbi:MAG: type II toxin-antitoxin system antitoxin SocA domain-containing protein [Candidatus Eisenbacteria bacterium]
MPSFGARVRALRESIGMSQQRLATLMGVARPTVSQIENDSRDLCADDLVKLSGIFGVSIDSLLDIEKSPQILIGERQKVSARKQDMRINVPQKNVRKFREVLLYLLGKVGSKPNIGETVLYKLLYFIDFNYYERYEEQLIGATYIKNRYGPTPIEFRAVVERMIRDGEMVKVRDSYFEYPQTKYLPLRRPNLSELTAREAGVIDDVLNRLSDMTAAQISEYSHADVPWLTAQKGKPIEYESVFYRTAGYSVRECDERIQEDQTSPRVPARH